MLKSVEPNFMSMKKAFSLFNLLNLMKVLINMKRMTGEVETNESQCVKNMKNEDDRQKKIKDD